MVKQEVVETKRYSKSLFETLFLCYRPYLTYIAVFFFVGLAGRLLLLFNANIIGIWVDRYCDPSATAHCKEVPGFFAEMGPNGFIVTLLLVTSIGFLFTWLFRLGFSRYSALAVSRLYDETTFRTSRFPLSFFDRTPVGRVVTRFSSDYGNVFRLFGGPLAEFLSIIFDLIGMIILVTVASPYYLPLVILIALANFVVYRFNKKGLRQRRRELSASRSPSIAHFAETTQGASSIRIFNKEKTFSHRFKYLDSNYLEKKRTTIKAILLFSLQMNALTGVLLLGTGLLAQYLYSHGMVSVGSMGVAFGFIALSGNTIQMFFEWMANFEEALVGVERMDQYLRSSIEAGALLPKSSLIQTGHWRESIAIKPLVNKRSAKVEFDQVRLSYLSDQAAVLRDVSFTVNAGERLGIVGRTGSGKSSLIQALFYFYPLSNGKITVDGIAPKLTESEGGMDLKQFRRQFAFIAQEPTLFKGSILENLDIEGQHSLEEVKSALRTVGLGDWATAQGLEFPVEERGRNLSLGEKQLISLARCLLQDAPVVIMDEATSSVDPLSEEMMVKATNEFFEGRTQLIIAHRLSTLEKCDRILWLHQGKVHRLGPTHEVLKEFRQSNLLALSKSI